MQLVIREQALRNAVREVLAAASPWEGSPHASPSTAIVVTDDSAGPAGGVLIALGRAAAARATWRFRRHEFAGVLVAAEIALLPELLRLSADVGLSWSTPGVPALADVLLTLTERQLAIAERVVGGARVREIAQELGVAEATVKRESCEIRRRMGVRTRLDLARRLGLLDGHDRTEAST